MIIPRIYADLNKLLEPGKVLVLYGPRRVGKTTLIQNYLKSTKYSYRLDTGDDIRIQQALSSQNLDTIKDYVGNNQLIVIDEAQNIENIGSGLKLIVDHLPHIRTIATGSASFDLSNKLGEPLVGRKWTKILYPVSQLELTQLINPLDQKNNLEKYLIYGSYPEVLTASTSARKQQILNEITWSYLLKDLLAIEQVKSSQILIKLLKLLAFQIGSEVSLSELGLQLEIDKKTVSRYLDLLEKTFIIFSIPPYYRNLRKAISKKNKYFFIDTGIRNALINNYNPISSRDDLGQLWENFLATERIKKQTYKPIYANNYFWRTYDQKEIDWVEMRSGKLFGYEFKWNNSQSKHSSAWMATYPQEARFSLINQQNYLKFLT